MLLITSALAALVFCFALVRSAPNPPTPAPVAIGANQTITWEADTTGKWTSGSITLMSGQNLAMTIVTAVATGIDMTKTTSFTWTVPNVTPTSAIYFFEFDQHGATDGPVWTTRWAITAADGSTTPPAHSTQPNGEAIPWGTGQLVGGSSTSSSTSGSSSTGPTGSTSTTGAFLSTSNSAALSGSSGSYSNSVGGSGSTQVVVITTPSGSNAASSQSSGSTLSVAPTKNITQGSSANRYKTSSLVAFAVTLIVMSTIF